MQRAPRVPRQSVDGQKQRRVNRLFIGPVLIKSATHRSGLLNAIVCISIFRSCIVPDTESENVWPGPDSQSKRVASALLDRFSGPSVATDIAPYRATSNNAFRSRSRPKKTTSGCAVTQDLAASGWYTVTSIGCRRNYLRAEPSRAASNVPPGVRAGAIHCPSAGTSRFRRYSAIGILR